MNEVEPVAQAPANDVNNNNGNATGVAHGTDDTDAVSLGLFLS